MRVPEVRVATPGEVPHAGAKFVAEAPQCAGASFAAEANLASAASPAPAAGPAFLGHLEHAAVHASRSDLAMRAPVELAARTPVDRRAANLRAMGGPGLHLGIPDVGHPGPPARAGRRSGWPNVLRQAHPTDLGCRCSLVARG